MDTIYKYGVRPELDIALPKGSKPLCVQLQKGIPQLWIRIATDAGESEVRHFVIVPTGGSVNHTARYIGTFQLEGGELVFHVFEVFK